MKGQAEQLLHFVCGTCGLQFRAEASRSEAMPERDWLPIASFAACLDCGRESPQAQWEVALAKGWANATGPRTAEGKAATAKNLVGHPTPEEAKRTRFNAMKHGLFADVAQYFPARPGKYPQCETCEHFNNGCNERPTRQHKNPPACLKRIERNMVFRIAFETGDPKMLKLDQANLQSQLRQLVDDMLLTVMVDTGSTGRLKAPDWYYDKDGGFHLASYYEVAGGDELFEDLGQARGEKKEVPPGLRQKIIYKITDHPLLKHIIDLVKQNGWTMPESGMTVKVQEDAEQVRGFLEQDGEASESALDYQRRSTLAIEAMAALVLRSQKRVSEDPVLREHEALEHSHGSGEAPAS